MTQITNDEIRRAQRVIRMISELHRLGYQRVRFMPFRMLGRFHVAIMSAVYFSPSSGAQSRNEPAMGDEKTIFNTGQGNQYFGWTDASDDSARDLADKFVIRFPRLVASGKGRDWSYAGWLAELVGCLEKGPLLPELVPVGPEGWKDAPHFGQLFLRGEDDSLTPHPQPPPGWCSE
jgi:hypothetical protein